MHSNSESKLNPSEDSGQVISFDEQSTFSSDDTPAVNLLSSSPKLSVAEDGEESQSDSDEDEDGPVNPENVVLSIESSDGYTSFPGIEGESNTSQSSAIASACEEETDSGGNSQRSNTIYRFVLITSLDVKFNKINIITVIQLRVYSYRLRYWYLLEK